MPQPNLKRPLLLRAAALLALFGLGLALSSQALWLGWALSLAALIVFGFWGDIQLGALVLGASFAGLAVWGLAFGIGGDSDGETIRWFLLVGLGSLALLAGAGLWSKRRLPGAVVMAGGFASLAVGFPPAALMAAGMAITWFGAALVRRLAEGA